MTSQTDKITSCHLQNISFKRNPKFEVLIGTRFKKYRQKTILQRHVAPLQGNFRYIFLPYFPMYNMLLKYVPLILEHPVFKTILNILLYFTSL